MHEARVILSPEVLAQLEADPEMAAAMRPMLAAMHQAVQAVRDGQHATFFEALEAITGHRAVRVDIDDVDAAEC